MFEDCYVRLGRGPFASATPLTAQLLGSLYALPECADVPVREALVAVGNGQPWSESLAIAPEQTAAAVGAMLRQVMLATRDLEPTSIDTSTLPQDSRVRIHSQALLGLWISHPGVLPSDLAKLKDFLSSEAVDALQPITVIWDRHSARLTPLERVVLEQLEHHHGAINENHIDLRRLIIERKATAAPEVSLAGHVQRQMLNASAKPIAADDTLAVLSVRDSLTECEAAAAIIQRWLADDGSLKASDIGVILPASGDYALYLAEAFARAGLVASGLPAVATRRNIGAEAVLHFVQCRRRPAPAMALASLYCSPVLCWDPETGNALAGAVMQGDFEPQIAKALTGKPASLFGLIRSGSPSTNAQLKEQLRNLHRLLSDDEALRPDVIEAKVQITRLSAALNAAPANGEPDWDKIIQFAAAYQAIAAKRGPYHLGGICVVLTHEAPTRAFRKLLALGFNDRSYPASPSGNPFFLDSEVALILAATGLQLPSQASQLDASLALFTRQLGAASEQVILLFSERDRDGDALSPSSSLPLISRLVDGCEDPEKLIVPLGRCEGTIWDRLIDWKPRPEFKSADAPEIPVHYDFGINLLTLRQKEDGTPRAQSPSRLEKLLVSPLAWLLGELGASHVSWQPEGLDVMLRGSLAHEVFERLFVPGSDHPDDATIDARTPELLMDRIRALAPFLQNPAWAVERTALEAEIIKSAKHWSMVLLSLGAEIVGNEFWLVGELFGHPVHGKADCLLRLPDGQPIVVDYKKSSSGTRRQRLQKGWDLQVDLYRKMDVRVTEKASADVTRIAETLTGWKKLPAVAYHTLNDGAVLINGGDAIDDDHIEDIAGDIAENALLLIKSRFEALKVGRLDSNTTADAKFFKISAALGTYALEDSPLVTAFMRDDSEPSVSLTEIDHD
jgi:hypothetical protein